MSRAAYLARTGLDKPRPGGRWHRILRALEHEPLTLGAIFRATDPGQYDERQERSKIRRALKDMSALGLLDRSLPWGWFLTPAGVETLAELNALDPRLSLRPPFASSLTSDA